jgi:hypothetical protein
VRGILAVDTREEHLRGREAHAEDVVIACGKLWLSTEVWMTLLVAEDLRARVSGAWPIEPGP